MEPAREPVQQDVNGQVTEIAMNPVPAEARAAFTDPFDYVKPRPDQQPAFDALTADFKQLYAHMLEFVPNCADRTLAIRALQESRMWANCAIVHDGQPYMPGPAPR